MKTKKHVLIENYPYIKKIYGDTISVKDLAYTCHICNKSVLWYIDAQIIFSTFSSNTHVIHVESLINENYIPPKILDLDDSLSHLDFYCSTTIVNKTIDLPCLILSNLTVYKIGKRNYYSLYEINVNLKKYSKKFLRRTIWIKIILL